MSWVHIGISNFLYLLGFVCICAAVTGFVLLLSVMSEKQAKSPPVQVPVDPTVMDAPSISIWPALLLLGVVALLVVFLVVAVNALP